MQRISVCGGNYAWCYGEELNEYLTFMSDDFEALAFDTPRYWEFLRGQE